MQLSQCAILSELLKQFSTFVCLFVCLYNTFCTFVFLQVRLLKDILEAWKKEVEKKPSSLTLEEAYDILKVKRDPSG